MRISESVSEYDFDSWKCSSAMDRMMGKMIGSIAMEEGVDITTVSTGRDCE